MNQTESINNGCRPAPLGRLLGNGLCILSTSVALSALGAPAEDWTVFTPQYRDGPPREMLGRYLKRQAYAALERRTAAYERVKTPEDALDYQARLREFFLEQLGPLPERTPLNAKVTGRIAGEGYQIEKLIYESQPQHYVTALLFLPTNPPPFPAVLMPSGHSAAGKVENQVNGMFLAKNGLAALCYDPIGQGERSQILDDQGKQRFHATDEHSLLDVGSALLGRNTVMYRIWDGMRSIDYLVSQPDIIATKLGVTGCSGGGTLSSYLMALDDRLVCAAPSCYLTSFRRLLDTIGPQDAEQNIPGQIAFGLDHADYVLLHAPKPTLILAGTHDFFDIQGTWDTFRQAVRWYTRLGVPERMAIVETDTQHGYPQAQREAMVRWMTRWLLGRDQLIVQPAIQPWPEKDLICTPEGQTLRLAGARSVVDLNAELNQRLTPGRRQLWESADPQPALATVRRLAGIRPLAELPSPLIVTMNMTQVEGGHLDRFVFEVELDLALPVLLFRPSKPSSQRYLYVNGEGKQAGLQSGGIMAQLMKAGHTVLAVDVRGTGELGPAKPGLWGGDMRDIFLARLIGKSLVGTRAEDILICARYLSLLENAAKPEKVNLIAVGSTGPAVLHAVALERQLFDNLTLINTLRSWTDVVLYPAAPGQAVNVVFGARRYYDLPDLLRRLPADKLRIEDPLDLRLLTQPSKQ
jgi:dienelactone hydrolase